MDNLKVYSVFDTETTQNIHKLVEAIETPRWLDVEELQPGRAVKDAGCKYEYCNEVQMRRVDRDYLRSIAPQHTDFELSEVCVNKYNPGDFIGKHRDRHEYRKNLVVSLQDSADGLFIHDTEEFVRDKAGQGVEIVGVGPVHSVPPVSKTRYSLIFLYE